MKIVFRVDASNAIGSGHVMRCLTLAEELRSRGFGCEFICRSHIGHLGENIESKKFKLHMLPADDEQIDYSPANELAHASWLGCRWQTDAEQTNQYLEAIKPEWLIVDHYALDNRWENKVQENCQNLLAIDDLADRLHECDILLDQNLFKNLTQRYSGKVPDSCLQLLGPKYALLQPIYSRLRSQVKARKLPLNKLMIFFGGFDACNLTGMTLAALDGMKSSFSKVDVVLSKQSPNYHEVKDQIKSYESVVLHSDLPTLAPLMLNADLAIGAGGATSWERLCLGLPSLVITLAENQRTMNLHLHEMNLVELIGDVTTINQEQITLALENVLLKNNIEDWSVACMEVCKGDGVSLVVGQMMNLNEVN